MLCLFISMGSEAMDLGTFGHTWPIAEQDIRQVIQQRLHQRAQDGRLEAFQRQFQTQLKARIHRPSPVKGLTATRTPRQFFFDPSITLPIDLRDHQQTLIHAKGTTFNPLHHVSLTTPLLFFDGDAPDHVQWAETQSAQAKWILTQGAPFQLAHEKQRPVYFDQDGQLVKKFGIQQLPARVTQAKDQLLIEEIMLASSAPVETSKSVEESV